MNMRFQSVLLQTYRLAQRSGVLSHPIGQRFFLLCYRVYKTFLEANGMDQLSRGVQPGDWMIDVGANVGHFSLRFGRWVSGGGRVLALEPEPNNFRELSRCLTRAGLEDKVEAFRGVAAERSGQLALLINPHHPGDHKLGDGGLPVAGFTLDDLMKQRNWPPVSLIKIDVQGAEERVLAGASQLLRKTHPDLYVEIGETALESFGSTLESIVKRLADSGYRPYYPRRGGMKGPLTVEEMRAHLRKQSYGNFLFLTPNSLRLPVSARGHRPLAATVPAASS